MAWPKKRKAATRSPTGSPEPADKRAKKEPKAPFKPEREEDEKKMPRRVGITDFKGTTYISIREFYSKDGVMMPGTKGLNLTVEQFESVVLLVPEVVAALAEKGAKIRVDGVEGLKVENVEEEKKEDEDEEMKEGGGEEKKKDEVEVERDEINWDELSETESRREQKRKERIKKVIKRNFEATSSEED
ncbi:hypothetical protein EJ06DRAFT_520307 [Trichodelitschia bisporula]|uniref:Transcriptional coactivator p15 (PC4) C-terminal domain-containing protein n=1 Tax=Trichodelitschia bisporula TaxID=703511 RepID=A0A6G1I1Z1_9PEZI|nr:hypothetical protein EJ06DRAFT_520307 [Trichodelitschia bisporula]